MDTDTIPVVQIPTSTASMPNRKLTIATVMALMLGLVSITFTAYTATVVNTTITSFARSRKDEANFTALTKLSLKDGQSIDVDCASWNLLTQRSGRTTMTLMCSGRPNPTTNPTASVSGEPGEITVTGRATRNPTWTYPPQGSPRPTEIEVTGNPTPEFLNDEVPVN